jgi:hypothetical protein
MTETCDDEVFKKGHSIATIDACSHRAEVWVQSVAKESGQRVDWHYTGDYKRVLAAIKKLLPSLEDHMVKTEEHHCRCGAATEHSPGRIFGVFRAGAHGPYRAGDELPEGIIGVVTTDPTGEEIDE